MSLKNAIAIGKGLGTLIKVDEASGGKKIFRSYLRLLVEIDITQPVKAGFSLRREEYKSLWIYLKYERLDMYCASCGRIGHKLHSCQAPSVEQFLERYTISLKVTTSLMNITALPLSPAKRVLQKYTKHARTFLYPPRNTKSKKPNQPDNDPPSSQKIALQRKMTCFPTTLAPFKKGPGTS